MSLLGAGIIGLVVPFLAFDGIPKVIRLARLAERSEA
jgi:hypothetical protein